MFARLAQLVVHHPWRVILAWVIAAVAIIGFAPTLTSTSDTASFLPRDYESIKAQDVQEKAFPSAAAPAALVVVERRDGSPLTAADSTQVTEIAAALTAADIPFVDAITATPASSNRLVQIIAVQMPTVTDPADTRSNDAVTELRAQLQGELSGTELVGGITGSAAQQLDAAESGSRAEVIIGVATIGLILVLLLIIFRSPIIAFLPVITIGVVSQVATGLIAWANDVFGLQTDSSSSAILIVVLFGVGTDYILFLMFRYRERLRAGEDSRTAMIHAVSRVGEAITSAAFAVIIAFLALTLSTLGLFKSLGPALAIAVAVTLVAGLTLIPAIVSLLGTRVFWPSKAWRTEPKAARITAVGNSLGRHPVRYVAGAGGAMLLLSIAALGFSANFDLTGGSTASASESSTYSQELLKGLPAGATQPTYVFLQSAGDTLTPAQLSDFGSSLTGVAGVGTVGEPVLSEDGTVADYTVTLADSPESKAAIATVDGPLREAAHAAAPGGATALVGGVTAIYVDIQAAVNHDYLVVFPVAALLIMAILALQLRNLVAPVYLMISVGLGFTATLGATVLIFQQLAGEPGLLFILPVIMYLFVVALGTDYNILMVSRLREEAQEGRSPRQAAALAVRHAGPTIAAAGLILAGTFASLMLAGNATLTQMGFAISFGIAISAFVMAMFLTPALTALLGHAAWWPGNGDSPQHGSDHDERATVAAQA